jgi:hypothetical protein
MHVTICGHAALFIETADQRMLVDPCFSDTLVGGAVTYHPGRAFDTEKMPLLTALVITHGHFDHFHLETLQKLPRNIPVITAKDPHVVQQLAYAGFSNVIACEPWHSIELGNTRLLTTPSEHDEPEFGLLIRDEASGAFWHMADAEVNVEVGERLVQENGFIDLISAKYQPLVRASIGYLRDAGAAFDKREVATWLETACVCEPALIFPYAAGLCFSGRHSWFNRYAFPLSPEEVVRMLQSRLGSQERAAAVRPGDMIELRRGQRPVLFPQASPFVRETNSPEVRWEPVDISTLAGLSQPEDRRALQRELEAFMSGPLASWLERTVGRKGTICDFFREQDVVWQLVVHAGDGERLNYFIDFRSTCFSASRGQHPEANSFTHVAGRTLCDVLKGDMPGILFWLAGEARSYEKILGVRAGHFWVPELPEAPEDWVCDPLTYYLRHFGTAAISLDEPEATDLRPRVADDRPDGNNSIEVLARQGEDAIVTSKKALLTYLSAKEAERIGLEITDDEVEATSNDFRRRLNLYDQEATMQWLKKAGMSPAAYSAVMRGFAAVLKLENHYAGVIEPLLTSHRRMAIAIGSPLLRPSASSHGRL